MNALFAFADSRREWNCSQWRAKTPSDAINKYGNGHSARCLPLAEFQDYGHPAIQEFVARHDIIIVQRNLFTLQVWNACDYWRALGKCVVADLDDDYPRLTPQNPAWPFWIVDVNDMAGKVGMTPVRALEEGLRHVDALLSPSKEILADWADVVPGYHLPNFADGDWYEGIEQKPVPTEGEQIIIGWGGSVSHFDSWWFSGLREAIIPLMDKYPLLHWKLCGNDWRLMKWASGNLPEGRWYHQDGVPPEEWPRQVALFDIGVAPLSGPAAPQTETYDNRRSWLKAVEYLLCGVPWIASPGPVYEDLDGQGGFCVRENSTEAWTEAVSKIVDNLTEYKAKSKELIPWAYEALTMKGQVENYMQTLETVKAASSARAGYRLPDVMYVGEMMGRQNDAQAST